MTNELPEKLPPQSVEAEKSLLGCLMLDKEAIFRVYDFLKPDDFYKKNHQEIYTAMVELFTRGEPIDFLSVSNRLKDKNLLEEIGGNSFLTELINSVATASHIANYAKIVQKKRILRDLISASQDIASLGYNESEDIASLLDQAEKRIFSIAQKGLTQEFVPVKDTLEEAFERIDKLSKREAGLRGLPSGFADLDNILAGFQKSDLIILAARPTLGKCVAGNTEIVNPNPGSISTIEEVIKNKKKNILTLDNNLKIVKTEVSDFINNGKKPVFLVKTKLGKEIETTINHPFLTIDGWKPLGEIKINERIAVPRKIPIFGKTILPDYQVKCLAYFISEGGLTNLTPRFTNSNKYIIKDFVRNVLSFPKVKIRQEERKKGCFTYSVSGIKERKKKEIKFLATKIKKQVKRIKLYQKELARKSDLSPGAISYITRGYSLPLKENLLKILKASKFSSKEERELIKKYNEIVPRNSVTDWLKSFGLMKKHSREKFIPQIVFTFNKKTLSLFLNRLFSGDGVLWQDKKSGYFHLSYSSSSKKLAKQVQHLLLRFGVVSKLREKRIKVKDGVRSAYELEVHSSEFLLTFIKEIGIYGNEKKLKELEKKLSQIKTTWAQDTLPIEIWKKILEIKGEKSWYSIYPKLGMPKTHNIHVFRRCPRRETVAKLAKAFNSSELKNLAESEIYWDKIVSIGYIGEKKVYDLTIPKTHNFIANDFIVHNSAMALNFGANIAINAKIPVGIFSLEMSRDQVVDRLISSLSGVDLWRLRTGRLSSEGEENDFTRIRQALGVLSEAPIYIDDAASPTALQMKALCRRLQAEKGLGLVIIDYLQLMEPLNPNANPVQQVSENSRALKALARELNIPVLVVSQLSRAVEMRSPQIPRLADLRQSGTIEQDADVVLFIYREDRYNPDTPRKNIADIIIAKHRNGPVGKVELYFDERVVSFRNLEKTFFEE